MAPKRMKMANLDEASLARLQKLEKEFGSLILALEPIHPLAKLTDEQVARLQELEKELGVTLIAYTPQS